MELYCPVLVALRKFYVSLSACSFSSCVSRKTSFCNILRVSLLTISWMRGEAHDHEYPEEAPIAVESTDISALILSVAFVWLFVYYVVLLPLNVIHSSKASLLEYDDGQMRPRCVMFKNFRQYENVHMLFWISKDLAWNRNSLFWWLIFLFPTLFISADLLVIALTSNSAVSLLFDFFYPMFAWF